MCSQWVLGVGRGVGGLIEVVEEDNSAVSEERPSAEERKGEASFDR